MMLAITYSHDEFICYEYLDRDIKNLIFTKLKHLPTQFIPNIMMEALSLFKWALNKGRSPLVLFACKRYGRAHTTPICYKRYQGFKVPIQHGPMKRSSIQMICPITNFQIFRRSFIRCLTSLGNEID